MSQAIIGFVGCLYLVCGFGYLYNKNWPMALVFISYATANVGLYIVGK